MKGSVDIRREGLRLTSRTDAEAGLKVTIVFSDGRGKDGRCKQVDRLNEQIISF